MICWLVILGGFLFPCRAVSDIRRHNLHNQHVHLNNDINGVHILSNFVSRQRIECGPASWFSFYEYLYRRIDHGDVDGRYLYSTSVGAGLGDRMSGLMSGFFYALITNRAIKVVTSDTLPSFLDSFDTPLKNVTFNVLNNTVLTAMG